MATEITLNDLKSFEKDFDKSDKNLAIMDAVCTNGIVNCAISNEDSKKLTHAFSTEVEGGNVTDQKRSGRCWMFAATNVMRFEVMKNLNLPNMELSQSYPLFYDKLEKANYFLEAILTTLDEKTSSRTIAFLLSSPMGDGGQWDMFADLIRKYGICPKSCMPETFSSSNTLSLDKYLTLKLREYAKTLRTQHEKGKKEEDLRPMKKKMLTTIYRMLVIALGKPPLKFTFETRDKKNNFVSIKDITPVDFYNTYVKLDLSDYVSVINAPTSDKPFNRSFTVNFLGNVKGGKPVRYLNLPIKELKMMAINQLKDGNAVWFGSDVGQYCDRLSGKMSKEIFNLENLFSTEFPLTKAERLDYGESLMTHAMTLTGVNLVRGRPNRWKVENSWGPANGNNGFFVMDDKWFDEFTYQVVINKKYLTPEQLKAYESDPIVLEPWDPMGSLAL
ncbi:MAG: C1 family peptidase [Bacilli bacterium]